MARPSIHDWTGTSARLAGLAVAALAACGGVSVESDPDGSPDGEVDGGEEPEPDADPGGSPDADPVPDAQPPGTCEDGVTQLLFNPGFDQAEKGVGAVGWIEDPIPVTYPDPQLPIDVHSPTRALWIGDQARPEQRLTQAVTVPESATSLSLELYTCFATDEDPAQVLDRVTISLLDSSGSLLEELEQYTNQDADSLCVNWSRVELPAADSHAGEEVRLEFFGLSTVPEKGTSFYFDTLALNAVGPCP